MSRVLIVEDSPTQAKEIQFVLEAEGFEVSIVTEGQTALAAIDLHVPDLVLTDLEMPGMSGMQLVSEIRARHAYLPVVLMTARGSEDVAAEALQKGAASYVPKRRLQEDLVRTLRNVLSAARRERRHEELLDCLTFHESGFVLGNAPWLITPLVSHLQQKVTLMKLCDDTSMIRLGIALDEALTNALYHGNLELSSDLRWGDGRAYSALAAERRNQAPYRDRRIHVRVKVTRDEATFIIRDEGPGFDPATLPDPSDPVNLEKESGRGLLLIRTFMDEVRHNETGNEITMVKRRER